MGKPSSIRSLTCNTLAVVVLVLWLIASGFCCPKDFNPGSCQCEPFGPDRIIVHCCGITHVPHDLPPNTAILNLTNNQLSSIQEYTFLEMTMLMEINLSGNKLKAFAQNSFHLPNLKKIDLSRNTLKFIPENAFQNLTKLTVLNLEGNLLEHIPQSAFQNLKKLKRIFLAGNKISLSAFKVFSSGLRSIQYLDLSVNPIGPNLTSDTFSGFSGMKELYLNHCGLTHIDGGTFEATRKLRELYLAFNSLSHLQIATFEGPPDVLKVLHLDENKIRKIEDGTFKRFTKIEELHLSDNQLKSVPDLPGLKAPGSMMFSGNQIETIHKDDFRKLTMLIALFFSFGKLQYIPDGAFSGCRNLIVLHLNFNNITDISPSTFTGLTNLRLLGLMGNNLRVIPDNAFADATTLEILFLHSNKIKQMNGNPFNGLSHLQTLTIFENPLTMLPLEIFHDMTLDMKIAVSCKILEEFIPGNYSARIICAPSESFFTILTNKGLAGKPVVVSLEHSGFTCHHCHPNKGWFVCKNCSFCAAGTYSNGTCRTCPAGGFYQDEMGQIRCKNCSTGTYVPESRHPGKSPTDCLACPYGTQTNQTAGYRACRCLHNFYRLDRFGPCTLCPDHGMDCRNDTAILAPGYFWKWNNTDIMGKYSNFVANTHIAKPEYDKNFTIFEGLLPKPLKCPYPDSCKGGINSSCSKGYQGILCTMCSYNHYFRFNSCLQCPNILITIISSVIIVVVFVLLFALVLWGDSKRTQDDRTVADVIMSCAKIVIGFYQVVAGIYSALARVQWPVVLVSMEKYLKFFEGNILQFAPLSCIHPQLRLDPFIQFVVAITINVTVVCLILLYLFLKKLYINRMDIFISQKRQKISALKKSCYRNIFLFLLLSYPTTSKKIINILPLPGVCVNVCFNYDSNDCISLLKADHSIRCFTTRHDVFWRIAAVFALYPVIFPLLLLFPIYKYRRSGTDTEISFGLKVFFENYKDKYWYWEIVEMYRKLTLVSVVLLFGSESHSQIGFAVIAASASGIAYTLVRPIKGKFEDGLQTFVLWIIFFNVCLGAVYSQPTIKQNQGGNDSIFVNVLFVVLNSAVLFTALVEGLVHLKSVWKNISLYPVRCFCMVCDRVLRDQQSRQKNVMLTQPLEEERFLLIND